jgi:uncharacterized PurR-regulated membrane protein YhhQ (DUF165 family)
VRAYEARSSHDRDARSVRIETGVADGPYRLRGASDVTWAAQGYGQRDGLGRRVAKGLTALARIVVPVTFLSMSLAAMYLYLDHALPYFADAQGRWLTVSHLLLPLAFLCIHLTNRRYGPSYAFAQIVATCGLCGAIILFGWEQLRHLLPASVVPSAREAVSFTGAFFAAGFISIITFDGARGPRWWIAPLLSSLVAGVSFVMIFYPAAFAGTATPWGIHLALHGGILVGAAFVGLVPYWLLRGLVPPLPGFGGY